MAGVVLVEIASFLAITLSNYWIYGQIRDGEPVRYDPYALFMEGERPTVHNHDPWAGRILDFLALRGLHHAGRHGLR